jgi:hypothetical protein
MSTKAEVPRRLRDDSGSDEPRQGGFPVLVLIVLAVLFVLILQGQFGR